MKKLLLASALTVLGYGSAVAQVASVADLTAPASPHHSWFGDVEAGVRVMNLPEIGLFTSDATNGPLFTSDPTVVMGGGSLRLGHVFGQQLDPQIWGARMHVSAGGFYYTGSEDERFSADGSEDPYFDWLNAAGFVFLDAPINADVSTDYTVWGADVRLGLDFAMGGGFVLTPSVSFFGGQTELEQDVAAEEEVGEPLPHFYDQLNQQVDTSRLGGGLGLGATWDFGNGLQLRGGAQIALTYNNTNASAYECAGGSSFTPGCNGLFYENTTTFSEEQWGYVASGGLGISYDLGFGTIGIAGELAYDSYQPVVDWANSDGDIGGLSSDSAWSYGGSVFLTIPIN